MRSIETDASVTVSDLTMTLELYQGELLPRFYDNWIVGERERLHNVFEQKMARLLELLEQARRAQEICVCAERWLALGQSPEPAYRALMQAHAALGNMSQVAEVYRRCEKKLRDDLGVEPSEQTRALYAQLKVITLPSRALPSSTPHPPKNFLLQLSHHSKDCEITMKPPPRYFWDVNA